MDDPFLRDLGNLDTVMASLLSSQPTSSGTSGAIAAGGVPQPLDRPGSTTSSVMAGLGLGSPMTGSFPGNTFGHAFSTPAAAAASATSGAVGARVGRRSQHQVSFVPIADSTAGQHHAHQQIEASPAALAFAETAQMPSPVVVPPSVAVQSTPGLATPHTLAPSGDVTSSQPAAAPHQKAAPTPLFTPNPVADVPSWLDGDGGGLPSASTAEIPSGLASQPAVTPSARNAASSPQDHQTVIPTVTAPTGSIAASPTSIAPSASRLAAASSIFPPAAELSPAEQLKREERELLSELYAIDRQLETTDTELRTLTMKVQSEIAVADTNLITKQQQSQAKAEELAASRKSFQASVAARRRQIENSASEELSSLTSSITSNTSDQFSRQAAALNQELAAAAQAVKTLEGQRDVLLLDGAFSEQGVYTRLSSSETIEQKLSNGLQLIDQFVDRQLSMARTKIQSMIRLETTATIGAIWNERTIMLQDESTTRRLAFGDFLHESLEKWIEFSAGRSDEKRRLQTGIKNELVCAGQKLRANAIARNEAAQQAVLQRIANDARAYDQLYRESMMLLQTRSSAVFSSDDVIAAQQTRDMEYRLGTDKRISDKMLSDELETSKQKYVREEQLHQLETTQQSVKALEEAKERCLQLVEGPSSRIHALDRHIAELCSAEQQRQRDLDEMDDDPFGHRLNKDTMNRHKKATTARNDEHDHLRQLLRDKEHVLSQLVAEVAAGRQALDHNVERCGKIRQQIERRLSMLVSGISEARCTVQSGLGRSEMIRLSWEKEHRAMLSRGHELIVREDSAVASTSSPGSGANGGRSTMMTGVDEGQDRGGNAVAFRSTEPVQHPLLESLILVAQNIRDKLLGLFDAMEKVHSDRMALLRHQNISDATTLEHYEKVSCGWNNLFAQLSSVSSQSSEVANKQVAVTVECAKLQIEQELLAQEKSSIASAIAKLSDAAERLRLESDAALQERDRKVAQLKRIQEEQAEISLEQGRLAQLQSDLRHRQDEVHRQEVSLSEKVGLVAAAAQRTGILTNHASAAVANAKMSSSVAQRIPLSQVIGPNNSRGGAGGGGEAQHQKEVALDQTSPLVDPSTTSSS